jgi:hypothetical protein
MAELSSWGVGPRCHGPQLLRNCATFHRFTNGISLAVSTGRSIVTIGRKVQVKRIRTASLVLLLASFASLAPLPAQAGDKNQNRRDRYEDRWDRREDQRDRREDRRDRREDRRDRREDRWDARDGSWDPAREYRQDNRRQGRRLGRNDRIYRGSDDRYYCKRDDGTVGLVLGGIAGGALGNIIAPRGSKTIGTIIGAAGGAILGKTIDDGDIVCK